MHKLILALAALTLVSGCPEEPSYVYPIELADIEYVFFDETEGIYPSTTVADSPYNPFATSGMDGELLDKSLYVASQGAVAHFCLYSPIPTSTASWSFDRYPLM